MNETISEYNLTLPSIGLGCMSLPETYSAAKPIIERAIDLGINFFDTADLYQFGKNEENLGKVLFGKRQQVILATKVGNQWNVNGTAWTWNPTKDYMLKAVEESLKRLKTDYLDLYQLHGGTLDNPWEDTLDAFQRLQKEGKIRAYGISSIRPNVVRKVMSMNPPKTIMMQYSPLDRRPEEEIFPLLEQTGTKVLVRGCFAKGLLIDKTVTDFLDVPKAQIKQIRDRIQESGFSPESVLIRFGLQQKAVGSLIIGASNPAQVDRLVSGLQQSQQVSQAYIHQLMTDFPPNRYLDHR